MADRRTSFLLTAVALTGGLCLLGAGGLTLILTATGPTMPATEAVSNYVAGTMLTLLAAGALVFVVKKGRL